MRTARQVTPNEIDSKRGTEEIKGLIIDPLKSCGETSSSYMNWEEKNWRSVGRSADFNLKTMRLRFILCQIINLVAYFASFLYLNYKKVWVEVNWSNFSMMCSYLDLSLQVQ